MTNKLLTSLIIILLVSIVGMSIVFHKSPIIGTEINTEKDKDTITTKTFTTRTGQSVTLKNTYSAQEHTSLVVITTENFDQNDEITVEGSKLTDVIFSDINNDLYEELVLVFSTQGERKESYAKLFTTYNNTSLTEIEMPAVDETTMSPGGPFEGYVGEDVFSIKKSKLVHEFKTTTLGTPIVKKKDHLESVKKQEEERKQQEELLNPTSYLNKAPKVLGASTSQEESSEEEVSTITDEQEAVEETEPEEEKEVLFTRSLVYELKTSEDSFVIELEEYTAITNQIVASSTYQLSGTVWEWISATGEANEVLTPLQKNIFIISFSTSQEFFTKTDCGELSGTYISGDGFASFGNITPQEKECPSTSQEKIYKELLLSATGYSVRGDKLFLTLPNDKVMIFSK